MISAATKIAEDNTLVDFVHKGYVIGHQDPCCTSFPVETCLPTFVHDLL